MRSNITRLPSSLRALLTVGMLLALVTALFGPHFTSIALDYICSALPATSDIDLTLYPPQSATKALLTQAFCHSSGSSLQAATENAPYRGIDLTLLTSGRNVGELHADHVEATAGGTFKLTMSTDGRTFKLAPQGMTPAPKLSFALRGATEAQPSYRIEVTATQLGPGQTITTAVDETTERLFIQSGPGVKFTITIERRRSDGSTQIFVARNVDLAGAPAYADFGSWQGAAMNLVIDSDGNGFDNDVPIQLANQRSLVLLPIMHR